MKGFFLFLLLWSSQLLAQNTVPPISMESQGFNDFLMKPDNVPVIKGKITNCPPEIIEKLRLQYKCIYPYIENTHEKTASIAQDGSFQLKLNDAYPNQQIFIWLLEYCFFQVYVTQDLYIEIDIAQIPKAISTYNGEGITFGGTDGELSTFLFEHFWNNHKQRTQLNIDEDKILRDTSINLEEFYQKREILQKQKKQLDSIFLTNHPSPYDWVIENIRTGNYLSQILMGTLDKNTVFYPQIPEIPDTLWKKCLNYQGYLVSNDCKYVYNYLGSTIYNRVNFKYIGEFCKEMAKKPGLSKDIRQILKRTIQICNKKSSDSNKEFIENYTEIYDNFDKELILWTTQKCLYSIDSLFPTAKADLIKMNSLISGDVSTQIKQIELLQKNIKTPWCLKILADKYQTCIKKIQQEQAILLTINPSNNELPPCQAVGQTNFGAHLYKVADLSPKQFLTQLKKNFTGKALVFEFWSTWCSGCPTSLHLMNNYRQELKNEAVEFIYLCTSNSSNEEEWKIRVAQLRIPGIHIFIDNKLNKQLLQLLSMREFYPTIAFFNINGDYQPDAFPQHSTPDNSEKIKKLLK